MGSQRSAPSKPRPRWRSTSSSVARTADLPETRCHSEHRLQSFSDDRMAVDPHFQRLGILFQGNLNLPRPGCSNRTSLPNMLLLIARKNQTAACNSITSPRTPRIHIWTRICDVYGSDLSLVGGEVSAERGDPAATTSNRFNRMLRNSIFIGGPVWTWTPSKPFKLHLSGSSSRTSDMSTPLVKC